MQLSYGLEADDLAASRMAASRHLYGDQKFYAFTANLVTWMFLGVGATIAFSALARDPDWLDSPVLFVSVALVLAFTSNLVFSAVAQKRAVSTFQRALAPYPLEQSLSIRPEGLAVESRLGKSEFPWAAVRSVEVAGGYIFVLLASGNVLAIPPSAFESTEHRAEVQSALEHGRGERDPRVS